MRRAEQARLERIPHADLGNGYFRNPVLVGPGSDNTVLRVDKDYYMLAGGGWPDQLVWHSRDLVNWRPITRALRKYDGGAVDASATEVRSCPPTGRSPVPGTAAADHAELSYHATSGASPRRRTEGRREMTFIHVDPARDEGWNKDAAVRASETTRVSELLSRLLGDLARLDTIHPPRFDEYLDEEALDAVRSDPET